MRWLVLALALAPVAALLSSGTALAASPEGPPGASSCSGCHAVSKSAEAAVPSLDGRPIADIVRAMQEFRAGTRPATVMGRIAKGFNDQEIDAIAVWFGAQK
jgi:sulfide dehydrogenase cytochrome subunit